MNIDFYSMEMTICDVDFKVFYFDSDGIHISGIYLYNSQVDLVEVLKEEVFEDIKEFISENKDKRLLEYDSSK